MGIFQDADLSFLWPEEPRVDSLWEIARREYTVYQDSEILSLLRGI